MQENRSLNEPPVEFPPEDKKDSNQQNQKTPTSAENKHIKTVQNSMTVSNKGELKSSKQNEQNATSQQAKIPSQAELKPKKSMKLIIILFFIVLLSVTTFLFLNKSNKTPVDRPDSLTPEASPSPSSFEISSSHNSFGIDVFKNIYETEEENTNIMISPSSIALALSMTYNGADEKTKEEMAKVLYFNGFDIKEVNKASNGLIQTLSNPDPKVEIAIANSIWTKDGVNILKEFYDQNEKFYEAKVQTLNFSDDSAADTINDWVSKNTKDKIPTIVEKPISENVIMYLINAIYFNGSWTYEFDQSLTEKQKFTASDQSTTTHPLMTQGREDFNYLETEDFQAASLPYGENKQLSMYVFLPKDNLDNFISLLSGNKLTDKTFSVREGTLLLPKFKLEYEKELSESLINLGMPEAFSNDANFSKMVESNDVKISKVLHKTFIDVNEEGAEAAAATSVKMVYGGVSENNPKPFYMEVNKPFFYAIVDGESSEILFMGVVRKPEL